MEDPFVTIPPSDAEEAVQALCDSDCDSQSTGFDNARTSSSELSIDPRSPSLQQSFVPFLTNSQVDDDELDFLGPTREHAPSRIPQLQPQPHSSPPKTSSQRHDREGGGSQERERSSGPTSSTKLMSSELTARSIQQASRSRGGEWHRGDVAAESELLANMIDAHVPHMARSEDSSPGLISSPGFKSVSPAVPHIEAELSSVTRGPNPSNRIPLPDLQVDAATAAAISAAQNSPGPSRPTRALRTRKAAQLQPYTVEMLKYRRELVRNDWQDAVVTMRKERERLRAEREEEDARDEDEDSASEGERRRRAQERLDKKERDRERRQRLALVKDDRRRQEQAKAIETRRVFDRFGGMLSDSGEDDESEGSAAATSTRQRSHKRSRVRRAISADLASDGQHQQRSPRQPVLSAAVTVSSDSNSSNHLSDESSVHLSRARTVSRPRPSSAQSGSGSRTSPSSDSDDNSSSSSPDTDYSAYFRKLKRMMPVGMARKHIDDLKNMRKGKAYHSDGHVSVTPEPETLRHRARTEQTTSSDGGDEVRPGEARKRVRSGATKDDPQRFAIVGDDESSSEHDYSGSPVVLSSLPRQMSPFDGDVEWGSSDRETMSRPGKKRTSKRQEAAVDFDLGDSGNEVGAELSQAEEDTTLGWVGPISRKSAPTRFKEGDAVDRMLQRTGGGKSRKGAGPDSLAHKANDLQAYRVERGSAPGNSMPDDAHDSFARLRKHIGPSVWSNDQDRSNVLRERRNYSPVQRLTTTALRSHNDHRRNKKRKRDDRIGRNRATLSGPAPRHNPPIVVPKTRTRLDLQTDRALFESNKETRVSPPEEADRSCVVNSTSQVDLGWDDMGLGVMEDFAPDATTTPLRSVQQPGSNDTVTPQVHFRAQQRRAPLLDLQSVKPATIASPAAFSDSTIAEQQLEVDAWSNVHNVRIDFGISPPRANVRFGSDTFVGSGRLAKLLGLGNLGGSSIDAEEPVSEGAEVTSIFGVDLSSATPDVVVMQMLPTLFDSVFAAVASLSHSAIQDSEDSAESKQVVAALRALCDRLDGRPHIDRSSSTVRSFTASTITHLDRLLGRLRSELRVTPAPGSKLETLIYTFHWFRIELLWRTDKCIPSSLAEGTEDALADCTRAEDFAVAVRRLMRALLTHGLHRTMKPVKDASVDRPSAGAVQDNTEQAHIITEASADLWVGLMHLLNETHDQGAMGGMAPFWPTFEDALDKWLSNQSGRPHLVESELIWYSTIALTTLGQLPVHNLDSYSTTRLASYWPLIGRTLSIHLRFNEAVERRMPGIAISKRDEYIRVVLVRCFKLCTAWNWSMSTADSILRRLFDLFNESGLADLPSERDHDYPAFLREYDVGVLQESEVRDDDTAFQIFVRLLALAAHEIRAASADAVTADRKVGRLLSRMMPVRVMSFTEDRPPTSLERSMLFNHYTLVMLFLHLVPGAARQRVVQIKSFIAFADADWASQVACARAMMYAAIIYRHHNLSASPIMEWYSTVITTVCQQLRDIRSKLTTLERGGDSSKNDGHLRKATREQQRRSSLLVVCLRSIQHVVDHSSLEPARTDVNFPEAGLLDHAWTKDLLESQLAVDPSIGIEALNCIHSCLTNRNQAVNFERRSSRAEQSRPAVPTEESQDSMADMFDDSAFDFDDAALDALLGGQTQDAAIITSRSEKDATAAALKAKDRALAEHVSSTVSPALYRLLLNMFHPERVSEEKTRPSLAISAPDVEPGPGDSGNPRQVVQRHMEAVVQSATRRKHLELLIDCWAGCGALLVSHGMRSWRTYMDTFGVESFRRIDDPTGRRDVGLRFMHNIAILDPEAYRSRMDDSSADSITRNDFMAIWFQSVGALNLSIQNLFTAVLLDLDPHNVIFKDVQWPASAAALPSSQSRLITRMSLQEFAGCRLHVLEKAFNNMRSLEASSSASSTEKRAVYGWLSGLFLALRQNLSDANLSAPKSRALAVQRDEYVQFCKSIAEAARTNLGHSIISGTERGCIVPLEAIIARIEAQPQVQTPPLARPTGPSSREPPAQPPTFTPSPPDTAPPPYQSSA